MFRHISIKAYKNKQMIMGGTGPVKMSFREVK
jgi:hypothetical protein